jgi:hypothetical protein
MLYGLNTTGSFTYRIPGRKKSPDLPWLHPLLITLLIIYK